MSMPPPPYTLNMTDDHWRAIERLPHHAQQVDAMDFLMTYVVYTPARHLPNGDLKELKGEHKGLWQYDIDRDYRIVYRIDEALRTVTVEYVGHHPEWGKGRRGGSIRS